MRCSAGLLLIAAATEPCFAGCFSRLGLVVPLTRLQCIDLAQLLEPFAAAAVQSSRCRSAMRGVKRAEAPMRHNAV